MVVVVMKLADVRIPQYLHQKARPDDDDDNMCADNDVDADDDTDADADDVGSGLIFYPGNQKAPSRSRHDFCRLKFTRDQHHHQN